MKSLLVVVLLSLGAIAAPAVAQADTLIGDSNIEATFKGFVGSQAHATKFTATASGTATSASFYVDSNTPATRLYLGIYSVSSGKPNALLTSEIRP